MSRASGTGYVEITPWFRQLAERVPHRTAAEILEAQRAAEPPYLNLEWDEDAGVGTVRRPDLDGRMAGRAKIDPETEALRRAKIARTLRGRKRSEKERQAMSRGMRASIIRRNRKLDRMAAVGSVTPWREVKSALPSRGYQGDDDD